MSVIECICPPKAGEPRHPEGDTVELRERLDFAAGRTARNIIKLGKAEELSTPEIMTQLTDWYLLAGIRTWSVVDEKGKPVEPDRESIERYLYANDGARETLSDEADALYSEAVTAPLVTAAWRPSPSTSTNGSTSATNGSTSKHPKLSKRSSTITSLTDDTETTSPSLAGVSNS
jgi:hypothetical protein